MQFNPENKFENKELPPVIETVRVALLYHGKFLTLQKSADSKNPEAIELPGGKIDEIKGNTSTLEEQKQAAIQEVQQETGIEINKLPIEKIDNFEIYFEATDKNGIKKKYKRMIHLFLVRIPDSQELIPKINQTLNEIGEPEDKHKTYTWISPNTLINSVTALQENPESGEKVYPLSRNSRHIKKLLTATGY